MKKTLPAIVILLLLLAAAFQLRRPAAPPAFPTGDWRITFLTPKELVLTGSYRSYLEENPRRRTGSFRKALVRQITAPDFLVIRDCASGRHLEPLQPSGYWPSGCGLLRQPDGSLSSIPDVAHFLFISLPAPLRAGQQIRLNLKDGAVLETAYRPEIPSPLFKLNQVGNAADARLKYAYLGAWKGSAGPLSLQEYAGRPFHLKNAADHRTVFTGKLGRRLPDPKYQKRIPFTGEAPLELDYSSFSTPGRYYLQVENLGRSSDFIIGPEALSEPFYIHARGLFHKRCGQKKSLPCTAWEENACHTRVLRGTYPSETDAYRAAGKDWGFYDSSGRQIKVDRFKLIDENRPPRAEVLTLAGGWHDAADYDRKPEHLRIVRSLAMLYLIHPEHFIDRQLNLPESGNGIPDLLDEAAWGLKHLRTAQQKDGGIGTWIETDSHPVPGDPPADRDPRVYYLAAPGRASSMDYASAASFLALAFRKAGCPEIAAGWLESARRAWTYSMDSGHHLHRTYRYRKQLISYAEPLQIPAGPLLQAGVNLFVLTGDRQFLQTVLDDRDRLCAEWLRDGWRWSPLAWLNLFLFADKTPELEPLRRKYEESTLKKAGRMISRMNFTYPYRSLWHSPEDGAVSAMAWGNYHPFRQGLTLMAAHVMTGARIYRDALLLANDWHNGANPLGRSMTSGLGRISPACFLDLPSYQRGLREFVPGITPYGNTFGTDRNARKLIYDCFPGSSSRDEDIIRALDQVWPIWRRRINLEFLSIPASEYTVWETIAPAVTASGYLLEKPQLPADYLSPRQPAEDFRQLPGYAPLP